MNNYEFWNKYLKKLKEVIKNMYQEHTKLQIDLHIHSNYSADGKQSIKEIIESTNKLGFDIISITDHDTLDAYNEIYEYVKNGLTKPLIIPGVEFTIDNKEYGSQCHILQLFVNPFDKEIQKNVLVNKKAMFNRSKIQFKRLEENLAIQEICKKYNIVFSYTEYIKYLEDNKLVPEYDTLCLYIINKFKSRKITTFNILNLLEKYNIKDCYSDRKKYKEIRFKKLRDKYQNIADNNYNPRFLLSMLAVREVDDDWWDKPSSGSISVNSYGQIKISELNKRFCSIWAHPSEACLQVVEKYIKVNENILGIELNIRNKYSDINKLSNILNSNNLLLTIGSDSHDNSLKFYDNKEFYSIDSKKVLDLINYKKKVR